MKTSVVKTPAQKTPALTVKGLTKTFDVSAGQSPAR